MVEPGSYRTPNEHGVYENHDERAARQRAEADARQREASIEARFVEMQRRAAALERRVTTRLAELEEALVLAFGDMRREVDEQIERTTLTVAQRAELVRQGREIGKLRTEVEALRQELDEAGSKTLRRVK
ncbi:hypothetical protein I6F15_00150 [Bradyrhizobium sp. BRP14]|nr:hypothetical protein [Bradyrhizobium sp. BRP14]